jgi:hypothetical protein
MLHPNKRQFLGVLAFVDKPSDKSPKGARGHKVVLTRRAAENALESLIGMGINIHPDDRGHNETSKVGVIEDAEITGDEIFVTGYLFQRDCPEVIARLEGSSDYGMSYETTDAHVDDMRAEVWELSQVTFTGAAILRRDKAAYRLTDFVLL